MKAIKINSSRISRTINKKKIKWATNFLQSKIKKNKYLNNAKVECILIDQNSLNIEKFKNIYFNNDIEEIDFNKFPHDKLMFKKLRVEFDPDNRLPSIMGYNVDTGKRISKNKETNIGYIFSIDNFKLL